MAVQTFRDMDMPGEIGLVNANTSYEPLDESPGNVAACELARDFDSRLYHGPIYGRGYPASVLKFYAERSAPFPIEEGDLDIIATPTDFLGVNNYSRRVIQADNRPLGFRTAQPTLPVQPMGYEEAPHSLGAFVRWVSNEYGNPPIYITGERQRRRRRPRRPAAQPIN
ncbi:MAG: family 1 glycosylhydrolase, partial [Dehalococcoidia bacterium]|nr:family 1 glycosylhydrolase [Dehalococcoidia bacterium]